MKAIGEIVSGIFLLFFYMQMKLRMDSLPPEAQQMINSDASNTIGLIYALLIFSIVSSFVSAAVNIAAAIIGRKERVQLAELGKRIDSLDQGLAMGAMSFAPVAAGAGSVQTMAQPPMATLPEKSSSKVKIAVIAVVAIIVVAAVALALVMFVFNGGGTPGGGTPEQTFNTFVDSLNARNANGVVGQTVWTFASNRSDYVGLLQQKLPQGTFHVTILQGPDVLYTQSLSSAENAAMQANMTHVESGYGVDVSNYAVISFGIKFTVPQGTVETSGRMPSYQIEDRWYLDAMELLSGNDNQNNKPNGPGNQIQVSLSNNGVNNGDWTVLVNGVNSNQGLPLSNVKIVVFNSTGDEVINESLGGVTPGVNGLTFNDNGNVGQLDQNDEFLLDETWYQPGSVLRLTDPTGNQEYAQEIR